MKVSDLILDYAYTHNRKVVRKELMSWFKSNHPSISTRTVDSALLSLISVGALERQERGVMSVSGSRNTYLPNVDTEIKELHEYLKKQYPYLCFCIWRVTTLSAFMQHVPNIDILIVETEKIAVEAVYEELKGMRLNRKCLLKPNEKEYSLYGTGESCIIVRESRSEAPVIDVNGIPMASLEKILVDAQLLPELEFARGAELYTIYENAAEMYHVNQKSMLRYASRRGKKAETEKLIKSTMK